MPFDYQPILKGDLLELRPLRAEDWDELYAVASDPGIWEQHPASNRHELEVFRDFFRDAMASGGALLAVERASGRVIGSSRYQKQDDGREVEIGWTFLARAYWGGVHNGEMKRLMLEHALGFFDSVVFSIGPKNMRSRRAVEKIGAIYDGTKTGADGRESVRYRITALEFARQRQAASRRHDVRPVAGRDAERWLLMREALWPGDVDDHRASIDKYFAGHRHEPKQVLIAVDDSGEGIGFAELSIHNIVDGCETDHVGYLEGWYVVPQARRQGVGAALIAAAEAWARGQGCTEFASDASIENELSLAAHRALGFKETARVCRFMKRV